MAILWVFNIHYTLFIFYKPFECLIDKNKLSPVRNGDMGVDVFFVLSGFLISDILSKELMRDGEINVFHFLRSRFLRIWPAMLVTIFLNIYAGVETWQ